MTQHNKSGADECACGHADAVHRMTIGKCTLCSCARFRNDASTPVADAGVKRPGTISLKFNEVHKEVYLADDANPIFAALESENTTLRTRLEAAQKKVDAMRAAIRRVDNQSVRREDDQVYVQMWSPVWQALTDCLANSTFASSAASGKDGE